MKAVLALVYFSGPLENIFKVWQCLNFCHLTYQIKVTGPHKPYLASTTLILLGATLLSLEQLKMYFLLMVPDDFKKKTTTI